jgi:hypothetical protein
VIISKLHGFGVTRGISHLSSFSQAQRAAWSEAPVRTETQHFKEAEKE